MKEFSKKQLEIIKTTINYTSQNGMQCFTMRKIAKEIGIKEASLYSHFNSKEDILKGIFDLYKNEVSLYHNSLLELKVSKFEKIKMYFYKMCEFIQYKPEYMNLVMFELYQYRNLFKNDLNFLLENMYDIIENSEEQDITINNAVDYKWIILNIQGVLHILLKNKLLSENFDVLTNGNDYWKKLEKVILIE